MTAFQIQLRLAQLNRRIARDREIADAINRRWESEPINSRGMIALAVDVAGDEGSDADAEKDLQLPDRWDGPQ